MGVSQWKPVLWPTITVKCCQANIVDNRSLAMEIKVDWTPACKPRRISLSKISFCTTNLQFFLQLEVLIIRTNTYWVSSYAGALFLYCYYFACLIWLTNIMQLTINEQFNQMHPINICCCVSVLLLLFLFLKVNRDLLILSYLYEGRYWSQCINYFYMTCIHLNVQKGQLTYSIPNVLVYYSKYAFQILWKNQSSFL